MLTLVIKITVMLLVHNHLQINVQIDGMTLY